MIAFIWYYPTLPLGSLWTAYAQSTSVGKGIVLCQLILSIAVWSIMVGKWQELRAMTVIARRFRKVFDSTRDTLDIYFQQRTSNNPLALIYQAACAKLVKGFGPDALTDPRSHREGQAVTAHELTLVKGATEQTLAEQLVRIERGMNMLATGATGAPLLGLLGTVWGLLDAFQSMSSKGSAMLTDVAPGIASAMLTTVVGLLVAIPSSAGYNALLGRVRNLSIELDGFADELLGRLSCDYQGRDR